MSDYPERHKYFAHRYCRLLTKTCAAQEIGPTAFVLCVTIAMLEDSKRYTAPVTFYNDQLIPLIGVRKWKSLDHARSLAIKHGWLHYESSGTRRPGRYWVTIPPRFEVLDDSPCDEDTPNICYTPNGDNGGDVVRTSYALNGHSGGVNGGDNEGDNGGDNGGEPSTLTLDPNPKKSATRKKRADSFQPPTVEEVAAYCRERRNGIDPEAFVASYQKTGWRTKNNVPIKDWKACVITWEKYEKRVKAAATDQAEGCDHYD